jgi:hypothetical protein
VPIGEGSNGGNDDVSIEIMEPAQFMNGSGGGGGRRIRFTLLIRCEDCTGCTDEGDVCGVRLKKCAFKVQVASTSGGGGGWSPVFIVGGGGSQTGQEQYTECRECATFTITAWWHGSGTCKSTQIKFEELEAECVCCEGGPW